MGLNIGIRVKKQIEGYMCEGYNPKGTIDEIEERFFNFLYNKFPKGGFGKGWVSFNEMKNEYDFDVSILKYGDLLNKNGYNQKDIYLAITDFIYQNFSHIEGINMTTYWSG